MTLLFKYYLYTPIDLIYEFISQHAFDFFLRQTNSNFSRVPHSLDLRCMHALTNLEHREQRGHDGVEVGGGRLVGKVEVAPEELHPEEGEDEDEEEEEEEEGQDGGDGVHQGDHQVAQGGPVLGHLLYEGGKVWKTSVN